MPTFNYSKPLLNMLGLFTAFMTIGFLMAMQKIPNILFYLIGTTLIVLFIRASFILLRTSIFNILYLIKKACGKRKPLQSENDSKSKQNVESEATKHESKSPPHIDAYDQHGEDSYDLFDERQGEESTHS